MQVDAILVRDLMKYTPKELFEGLSGTVPVLFEDQKVCYVKTGELVFSRYFWDLLAPYPNMLIKHTYLIQHYEDNGLFTSKSPNKLLSVMFKDIVKSSVPVNDTAFDHTSALFHKMFRIVNDIYSEFTYMIKHHSLSISLKDFLEIQFDKDLMDAMNDIKDNPTEEYINRAYKTLDDIMMGERYKDNPVRLAYICGLVKKNQINQVLGPRGKVTEMDSTIFKDPITNSFTLGMGDLYELATDSRSGAKALFMSDVGISNSEYFARGLQLVTMVVEKLKFGDCGSTDYREWYVRPKEDNDGKGYPGDLSRIVGKYYLDEETNTLKVISADDTHLVGKTIKLRSADKCKLKNKKHICSTCFGELSYSVHRHTNLGHICTSTLTVQVSQGSLSTKHYVSSAIASAIILASNLNKFFTIKNNNEYVLKQGIVKKGDTLKMVIEGSEVFGIKDIGKNTDLSNIDPGRVTRIEKIYLYHGKEGSEDYTYIPIRMDNRYGHFELRFLNYIRQVGYEIDDEGRYHIDISRWKSNMPFMKVPDIEFNFLDFNEEVKRYFKTNINERGYKDTPDSFIQKLFTLISRKLFVNIAVLEVIVYAFSIYDDSKNNFDLSRGSTKPTMGKMDEIISNRSASAMLVFENTFKELTKPELFDSSHRPDHVMDVMIKPNEVIANLKKKEQL